MTTHSKTQKDACDGYSTALGLLIITDYVMIGDTLCPIRAPLEHVLPQLCHHQKITCPKEYLCLQVKHNYVLRIS